MAGTLVVTSGVQEMGVFRFVAVSRVKGTPGVVLICPMTRRRQARGETAGEQGEACSAESECAGESEAARRASVSSVRRAGVMALIHTFVLVGSGDTACIRAEVNRR